MDSDKIIITWYVVVVVSISEQRVTRWICKQFVKRIQCMPHSSLVTNDNDSFLQSKDGNNYYAANTRFTIRSLRHRRRLDPCKRARFWLSFRSPFPCILLYVSWIDFPLWLDFLVVFARQYHWALVGGHKNYHFRGTDLKFRFLELPCFHNIPE